MPARKEDAHRALELLEEYQQKLTRPQDQQLKQALEQVIKIFKSSLFQALLDIQEFYEITLLNDSKTLQQKTQEAQLMSSKFQKQSPFGYRTDSPGQGQDSLSHSKFGRIDERAPEAGITGHRSGADDLLPSAASSQHSIQQSGGFGLNSYMGANHSKSSREENSPHLANKLGSTPDNSRSPPYFQSGAPSQSGATGNGSLSRSEKSVHSPSLVNSPIRNYGTKLDDAFVYEDIVLERGVTGLGFSISGGNDNPHFADDPSDVNIYISKITDGGAAQLDGRMRVGDIVLQINDDEVADVEHQTAVEALRRSGNVLQIRVKRPKPKLYRFNISKGNRGLGISIAGGVGNEHVTGDTGIYVTKIVEKGAAAIDGRLRVNDKILSVGESNLDNCYHDAAVSALKNTGESVDLLIERSEQFKFFPDASSENQTTAIAPPVSASMRDLVYQSDSLNTGSPHRLRSRSSNRGESSETTEFAYTAPIAAMDEVNSDQSHDVRSVVLTKGANGLGFNIVGGEEGQGIFISYIVPGGSCDLNGQLRQGDRILSVNGINLRRATHEEAADALKNAGQNVVILAQYRPDEYRQFEEKIQELKEKMISASNASLRPSLKRTLHVRALFDYDPSRDSGLPSRGLPFCVGDILHVTNASDDEWWQAKRVIAEGHEEGLGIIPSKQRVDRKERARLKSVKFEGPNDSTKSASTSTLDRLTGRKKEKDKDKNTISGKKFGFFKTGKDQSGDDTSESEKPEERIPSYEPVAFERLKYVRPVIVMGPFKDRINDDLLAEFPDRFASCVPHTSRPKRENEVDGRDYHFAESREQLERDIQNNLFIEAGQYSDNLYGTSVAAVKDVAEAGKHCVLDVSGAAVKRLHANNMYPIVVYVKPKSVDSILEMNRRMTEDGAQKSWERCVKLEKEFGHLFTAVVTGDTPEEIYNRVKDVIYRESGEKAWIPSKERL